MNKRQFWDSYNASQVSIEASEDLKDRILSEAQQQTDSVLLAEQPANASNSKNSRRETAAKPHKRTDAPASRSHRTRRFALPIAACLAALTLGVGITAFTMTGNPGDTSEGVFPDFTVQAYAAGTDTILEMGNDSQIIFSRASTMYGIDDKENYLTEGYFTECLFRVNGDGIARVQASVSTGALYCNSYEDITRGENPDKWNELITWKPMKRGLGDYYGKYDSVSVHPKDDGLPKDSPDKHYTVQRTKQLGSTIDVPVDGDYAGCNFGFWTNEDYGDVSDGAEAPDAVIDLFDGATLTVTATFEDGHATTQVIELHAADVKASQEQTADGNWYTLLSPEIIDPAANPELQRYHDYVHTLYGVVTETNHKPFPGSLEKANELENVVTEPQPFPRQEPTRPVRQGGEENSSPVFLDQIPMHPSTDSLPTDSIYYGAIFDVSNVEITSISRTLPDGITLDDLDGGFQGDWEYFNRVTSQVDGYSLDENATPSEGFSWVMIQANLTNTSDTSAEITADGIMYGSLAIVEGDGSLSTALARSFKLLNGGWDTSKPGEHYDMLFDPQETKTVRWMIIVPDFILNDPSLFFLTYDGQTHNGMELTLPDKS